MYGFDYEDSGLDFADPGSGSSLLAATRENPRNLPCGDCGCPDQLTPADVRKGYRCNHCADAAERGVDPACAYSTPDEPERPLPVPSEVYADAAAFVEKLIDYAYNDSDYVRWSFRWADRGMRCYGLMGWASFKVAVLYPDNGFVWVDDIAFDRITRTGPRSPMEMWATVAETPGLSTWERGTIVHIGPEAAERLDKAFKHYDEG